VTSEDETAAVAEPPEIAVFPTADQYVRTYDLHLEVLRANRRLDDVFPPYSGHDFQAIYDRAQHLREQATALIDHLDQMRTPPDRPTAPDQTGGV
jgi:hypothetical protein